MCAAFHHLFFSIIQSDRHQESPTLNLVKDYLRFVIAFLDVIGTSAPHIYHSALPLSPRTSIVRQIYKQYACPLVRVVRGLPISWGPNVTTVYHEEFRGEVSWSPCSRLIAVAKTRAVEVLDAVTLRRLNKFESPANPTTSLLSFSTGGRCSLTSPANPTTPLLSFSPDSRYLTQFGDGKLRSWDLRTGDPRGTILPRTDISPVNPFSSTYSGDGRAVAVAWRTLPDKDTFIATYDLVSMEHTCSYHPPRTQIIAPIWTHGECLRFATVERGSVAVWEAQFTLTHESAKIVEYLPAPDEAADGEYFLFLPALSRLAFTLRGTNLVWDAKASRLCLNSGLIRAPRGTQTTSPPYFSSGKSFSSNGRFFASMTTDREVYVWEDSPDGYLVHQKIPFANYIARARPFLSPSGESIIASIHPKIHLWTTKHQILSSSRPTRDSTLEFILTFSPNKTLVAFARQGEEMVTVLDLGSGEPRLIIDASGFLGVLCLGMTDDTVVFVDRQEIVTWNVPAEKCTLHATSNINDSVRTTNLLKRPARNLRQASLSPDLSYVVVETVGGSNHSTSLDIFNVSTGGLVTSVDTPCVAPHLTWGGRQLWDVSPGNGWKIVQDSEPNPFAQSRTKPESIKWTECPSDVFPWQSTSGYKVTDDGWVLSPAQKRLLWLPHDWRSHERDRMWSGRFLGLLHGGLPEVVILEFWY